MEAERTLRIFAGVPLCEEARASIERAFPGRSIPPRNWHVTLCFLGNIAESAALRVVARVSPGPRFEFTFDAFGAFPSPERARVLWLGPSRPVPRLTEIAGRIREAATAEGIKTDARPYAPHLTLAKLDRPKDLRGYLSVLPPVNVRMDVDRVVFFESRLGKGPPVYAEWRAIALA